MFISDEPLRLDDCLERCKALTGTLGTLKKLAGVQVEHLIELNLSSLLIYRKNIEGQTGTLFLEVTEQTVQMIQSEFKNHF